MLKFLFILASLFIIGFLIVHDTWMITITAFGFRITTSVLTVIVLLILALYILHLLKKPFTWISGYQTWYQQRKQSQKETYLILALKTVLDKNTASIKELLKKKNAFFDKKSDENYLIEALFNPSTHTFEQLLHRPNTELAGIRGLLRYAQKEGDLLEVGRLLQKAIEKDPNEPWIYEALWQVQTLQSDWAEALKTLDVLKKKEIIDKAEYHLRKALILVKLGQAKEAYKLAPDRLEIALAYAQAEPNKAKSVLTDLWKTHPCRDAFVLFQRVIKGEKPATQMKEVEKLVRHNPENRASILALAATAIEQEAWSIAKEQLTTYLSIYPLTARVAQMMATVERSGWHHEEAAKEWEIKARFAVDEAGWGCAVCDHATSEWDIICPNCNTFGSIQYK